MNKKIIKSFGIAALSLCLATSTCVTIPASAAQTGLKLNRAKLTLEEGKTANLKVVKPKGLKNIKWHSSNSTIAEVNGSGKVTANKEGKCKITVSAKGKKATCKVKVVSEKEKEKYIEISETNFPGEEFRYTIKKFDLDKDGKFSDDELEKVISLSLGYNADDLTGMEFFTELESLSVGDSIYVDNTLIQSLDISGFDKLTTLKLTGLKNLQELKVNSALETLSMNTTGSLQSLDLSNATNLKTLKIENANAGFAELDLSKNAKLEVLNLNKFDTKMNFNVAHMTELKELYVNSGNIGYLDLSENEKLEILECKSSKLSYLELGSKPELRDINVYDNDLSEIDLSQCPSLIKLTADWNPLKVVDVTGTKIKTLGQIKTGEAGMHKPEIIGLDE